MPNPSSLVLSLISAILFDRIHGYSTFKPSCTLPPPDTRFVSGPNTRGTISILWNCLSIIILCTWSIQHLNVPAGRRRTKSTIQRIWWKILDSRRKIKWMLFTILIPEYIVGKALNDRSAAKRNTSQMQSFFGETREWEDIHSHMANLGYFVLHFSESLNSGELNNRNGTPLSQEVTTNYKSSPAEVQTPGQFELSNLQTEDNNGRDIPQKVAHLGDQAQFGQILEQVREQHHGEFSRSLEINFTRLKSNYLVLGCEQWWLCVFNGIADLPKVSARDLDKLDRGGGFVKILALIQVTYLIVQLIVRKLSGLSSSQLEVTALAFASSIFVTYILLWGRPQGVESVQIVEAKSIPDLYMMLQIVRAAPQYLWTKYRTSSRLDDDFEFAPIPNDGSHIVDPFSWFPNEYFGGNDELLTLSLGSISGGILFGGIHCLAWNFHFPTPGEAIAWRVCSVIISVLPLISTIPLSIWMQMEPFTWDLTVRGRARALWKEEWSRFSIGSVLIGGCLIPYTLARLFLIFEIFRTLFFLPTDAFIDTWSGSFPHWG